MDLEIREFEKKIVDDLNESGLPIEVKRLVFAEILTQIEAAADNLVLAEYQARTAQGHTEESNSTDMEECIETVTEKESGEHAESVCTDQLEELSE